MTAIERRLAILRGTVFSIAGVALLSWSMGAFWG